MIYCIYYIVVYSFYMCYTSYSMLPILYRLYVTGYTKLHVLHCTYCVYILYCMYSTSGVVLDMSDCLYNACTVLHTQGNARWEMGCAFWVSISTRYDICLRKKLSNNTFHGICSHCSTVHGYFHFTDAGEVLEEDLLQSNTIHPHVLKF